MNVLVVSGIWPPDVGGPASHAPEVAAFLRARGHGVEVVTTATAAPAQEVYAVRWVRRDLPVGWRHVRGAALVRARAGRADVVYTTGMFGRSALGARLARKPYVVKLTADPAHERARRRGLSTGDVAQFQAERGAALAVLRAARNAQLRGAARVLCPSDYLRKLVVSWGIDPVRVEVLPNPSPPLPASLPAREAVRERLRLDGPTLVFAGRLTAQKALDVALEAVEANDGVSLLVAGEGDERARLEARAETVGLNGRVRFLGSTTRQNVLELLRAADALLLSSRWENFPHAVVEALAVGTPVLGTAVGGVAEVVEDGRNGLLAPPGDAAALADVIRRFFADDDLRARLAAAASQSAEKYAPAHIYARLERVLREAASAS